MRHVICFGNALHGDDGFGAAVYQRLLAMPLPADVRVFDASTRGLDALALFEGCDEVMLVDALAPANCPGKISQPLLDAVFLESCAPGHGSGVGYLLRALFAINATPPGINILAAEAASLTPFQPGLSEAMERALDQALKLIAVWIEK